MVEAARQAVVGTTFRESISIWGPVGRAASKQHWLVTAQYLDSLDRELRNMEFLPQYLPESTWVAYAHTGHMQSLLKAFMERIRGEGGIPDCHLTVDRGNIDDLDMILQEKRTSVVIESQGQPASSQPEEPDVKWLAGKYGDEMSDVLYRVSTMRHEWLRRWRADCL